MSTPQSRIWREAGETGLYLDIVCDTNEAVDAANVADFDGNRLEFVHKAWNPA